MEMKSFPLLKLPAVPLQHVIKGFGAVDLFELLQCSTRTRQHLKQFEKANKIFKVAVDFQRKWIEIKGVYKFNAKEEKDNSHDNGDKKRTFCDREVPVSKEEDKSIETYWPTGERMEGTKTVAHNFVKSLGVGELDQILVSATEPSTECLSWLENCNVTLENFNLIGAEPEHADKLANVIFTDAFLNKVSGNFNSLLQPSKSWRPTEFNGNTAINMAKFYLQHSEWITGKHLMAFNVGAFVLYHSTLRNEDIKKYLDAWKSGTYMKLMYFSIHVNEENKFNFDSIIRGLTDEKPTIVENVTSVEFTRGNGDSIELSLQNNCKHFNAFVN